MRNRFRKINSSKTAVARRPTARLYRIAKQGSIEDSEDVGLFDERRLKIIVVDGASTSYDPASWAKRVSKIVQRDPRPIGEINWTKIGRLFEASSPKPENDVETLLKSEGSHATVLRVLLRPNHFGYQLVGESIGDCLLVVCPESGENGYGVLTWPMNSISDFPVLPQTVSSVKPHLDQGKVSRGSFFIPRASLVLVMSDALGKFLMRAISSKSSIREALPFLFSELSFDEWVRSAWKQRTLDKDDITIVAVNV